jgi:ribose 5-phosphate isomerase A
MGKTTEEFVSKYVKNRMTLSVGTSSLSEKFLKKLALALEEKNLKIYLVPSSTRTAEIAVSLGFEIVSINELEVDLGIEFCSKIDHDLNFLKDNSSSLVRDKMIAQSAETLIVVANESDYVKKLFGRMVCEVAPFGWKRTKIQLDQLGKAKERKIGKELLKTETGNILIDVDIDPVYDLEELDFIARKVPGVIETGIFLNYADKLVLLKNDKVKEIKSKIIIKDI